MTKAELNDIAILVAMNEVLEYLRECDDLTRYTINGHLADAFQFAAVRFRLRQDSIDKDLTAADV